MDEKQRAKLPRWTLRNDFRCTYRSELMAEEKVLRGEWIGEWREKDTSLAIPMSVEEGIARDLNIDVGDAFSLEVGGQPRAMTVASIRKVEWENLGLNFLFIFPTGVLEGEAGFNLMTTSTPSEEISGSLGRELGKRFPNITIFDASMVVDAILEIVTQVGLVIRFMALFTVFYRHYHPDRHNPFGEERPGWRERAAAHPWCLAATDLADSTDRVSTARFICRYHRGSVGCDL